MSSGKIVGARVVGLDVVRASAILMVLLCHYSLNYWERLFSQPTPAALQTAGLFGVQLFFALSGYLIGNILITIVDRGFSPNHVWRFWARRWMRTLPCYYVAVAIAVWASHINGYTDYPLWRYLTLSQNLLGQHQQFLGVSWSLTIEEWFYFLFPVLLAPCVALSKRHAMLIALVVVMVLSAIARPIAWTKFGFDWGAGLRVAIPLQLDSIAYGAMAAVLVRRRRLGKLAHWCCAVLGIGLFSGCWWYLQHGGGNSLFFMANGLFIGTAASGALITVGFSGLTRGPIAVIRPAEFLSKYSYTLYLTHMEMVAVTARYRTDLGLPVWVDVIAAPAAGVALAMLMTRFIEKPIMDRRPAQFPEAAPAASNFQVPMQATASL